MALAMPCPCWEPRMRVRRIRRSSVHCSSSSRYLSSWVDMYPKHGNARLSCQPKRSTVDSLSELWDQRLKAGSRSHAGEQSCASRVAQQGTPGWGPVEQQVGLANGDRLRDQCQRLIDATRGGGGGGLLRP